MLPLRQHDAAAGAVRCLTGRRRWQRTGVRKSRILRGKALRLPAGQSENRDGSGPGRDRIRGPWRARTRSTAGRNPAWRGDVRRKKGPEIIRALVDGGGGGNRTRVRKSSTDSPTCLARLFDLARHPPTGRLATGDPLDFRASSARPEGALSHVNDSALVGLAASDPAREWTGAELAGVRRRERNARRWRL